MDEQELRLRLKSGNSIPVDRVVLRPDEAECLAEALAASQRRAEDMERRWTEAAEGCMERQARLDKAAELVGNWRDSAKFCDDNYGNSIRDMADALATALSPTDPPAGETK